MGRVIVKLDDYYLEWSSIVDAPITFGMGPDEFEQYHRNEYGRNGHPDFDSRMARVEKTGTSSNLGHTPEDIILNNRAGPDETELTRNEIHKAYCLREPIRNGWVVPVAQPYG